MEKEILYLKKYIEEMDYCIEVDTLNCLLHELIIEYDNGCDDFDSIE